ncbi:MAG: nucleotidyltransferase domain-containing protein [Anaerolineaceae bacterium]
MNKEKNEIAAQDVIEFVQLMSQNKIEVWIDGGWGVDVLLGSQTRLHEDLDIAVRHRDAGRIQALLEERGYVEVPRNDSWLCNFVMGDEQGHLIDVHSCEFDNEGKCIFGVAYPFDSLKGSGSIDGFSVQCITPEWLVKFHTGYPLDENDYQDVKALCQKFKLKIPVEYKDFVKKDKPAQPA